MWSRDGFSTTLATMKTPAFQDADDYIASLGEDRRMPVARLRAAFRDHLPTGFDEAISYGMIGYVVPRTLYPAGYHCDPTLPLPFVQIASQKSNISVYHMGLYAMPEELAWFQEAWAATGAGKLDMGKSCIRLRKPEAIPFELFEELAARVTPARWIEVYEATLKR